MIITFTADCLVITRSQGFDGPAADVYSAGCVIFFMLRGYPPYDWEYSMLPPYDSTKLVERLQADDPWGGPLGGACDDESEPEEEDEPRLPISSMAVELVCDATRYRPAERPSALQLLERPWFHEEAPASANPTEANGVLQLGAALETRLVLS